MVGEDLIKSFSLCNFKSNPMRIEPLSLKTSSICFEGSEEEGKLLARWWGRIGFNISTSLIE